MVEQKLKKAKAERVKNHKLGVLSLKELKAYCEKNNIFHKGCGTKYDYIRQIDDTKLFKRNWDIIANGIEDIDPLERMQEDDSIS